MHEQLLKDYRCSCGKLLFKSVPHIAFLEIKCPRCGNIQSFHELQHTADVQAMLFCVVGADGCIRSVSNSVVQLLDWQKEEVIGKPLSMLSPSLHASLFSKSSSVKEIVPQSIFKKRSGEAVTCESHVLPSMGVKSGVLENMRILSFGLVAA